MCDPDHWVNLPHLKCVILPLFYCITFFYRVLRVNAFDYILTSLCR